MTSIVSHVAADEDHRIGLGETGKDVADIQAALVSAGYRVIITGIFDRETETATELFQKSQGLKIDGVVGPKTASFLDLPHAIVSSMAVAAPSGGSASKDPRYNWPHDDTPAMIAFYGNPSVNNSAWQRDSLITFQPPWPMVTQDEKGKFTPLKNPIQFHKKAAPSFQKALADIWSHYNKDVEAIKTTGMHIFAGTYNYRPVRGSSRLSCHAFGVAVDFDPARNAMNYTHKSNMAQPVIDAFKANGAWWGGDYKRRQDPMHFQWAHE